ncbi:hypothetical protein FLL45_10010 [Aliikangiella marina]|uniref:Thioredoxin domain-containing protein n=1 Tax=Aliikangiella marina TaxID=1712262 RepID=A0A545TDG9_9GAMM|nr:thioredoxin domain-containing protein [Aliikangiella marina]TQV75260.1 hypothetical protein FLL45_10010 [Aliikangiella marina]
MKLHSFKLLVSFGLAICLFVTSSVVAHEESIATINGEKITLEMLQGGNQMEIYEAEQKIYQIRMGLLKQALISKLVKLDPRSKGMDENEFIALFVVKPKNITDFDVMNFIMQRNIDESKINNALKAEVKQYLESQDYMRQIDAWFFEQANKYDVQISLAKPREPRFDVKAGDAPYLGGKDAKVEIVEFSDFECPYCAKATDVIRSLNQRYGDRIKIAYKHFPLNFHPNAQKAAEAGVCAKMQSNEMFWKLHDEMFANIKNLSVGALKDKAKKIGLDYEQFNTCLSSGKYAAKVQSDIAEGMRVGVSSTPVFFVNGRMIKGAQPIEVFIEKIEEELRAK